MFGKRKKRDHSQGLRSSSMKAGKDGSFIAKAHLFNPILIFWLSAIVIILTIGAGIAYIFAGHDDPLRKYYVMLSLVSFGLSSVSSLLFAVKADFEGTIGFFSMTVGGPAALWIIVMVVISHLPQSVPKEPSTIKVLSELSSDVERSLDWIDYGTWRNEKIGHVENIIKKDEVHHLKKFLVTTYYEGDSPKLTKAHISTLFIYNKKSVIKLQRISGEKTTSTIALPFKAYPTKPEAVPTSFLLQNSGTKDEVQLGTIFSGENRTDTPTNWASVTSNGELDCLIIAYYHEDAYPEGDYLLVDVKKYLDTTHLKPAILGKFSQIDLGIISFHGEIDHFNLWEMKNSLTTSSNKIPISFRLKSSTPEGIGEATHQAFKPWLETLSSFHQTWQSRHQKNPIQENAPQKKTLSSGSNNPWTCSCNRNNSDLLWHILDRIMVNFQAELKPEDQDAPDLTRLFANKKSGKIYQMKNMRYPVMGIFEWKANGAQTE